MFWNVPEHWLKRISLIEDTILSNPRQKQVFALAWARLINQLGNTVYTLYNVQYTHCTNELKETSSAVLYTHSTAKLLSQTENRSNFSFQVFRDF